MEQIGVLLDGGCELIVVLLLQSCEYAGCTIHTYLLVIHQKISGLHKIVEVMPQSNFMVLVYENGLVQSVTV